MFSHSQMCFFGVCCLVLLVKKVQSKRKHGPFPLMDCMINLLYEQRERETAASYPMKDIKTSISPDTYRFTLGTIWKGYQVRYIFINNNMFHTIRQGW